MLIQRARFHSALAWGGTKMATLLFHGTTNADQSDPSTWLERHGAYLFGYAMFRLRDTTAAEDAVQETLLPLSQSGDGYQGLSSERTWLTGIMNPNIFDHYRILARVLQA